SVVGMVGGGVGADAKLIGASRSRRAGAGWLFGGPLRGKGPRRRLRRQGNAGGGTANSRPGVPQQAGGGEPGWAIEPARSPSRPPRSALPSDRLATDITAVVLTPF